MKRIQVLIPEDEYDRLSSHVLDGLRSRVIRLLLSRAFDALEDPSKELHLESLLHGDFTVSTEAEALYD